MDTWHGQDSKVISINQANVLIDSGSVSLIWLVTRDMINVHQAEEIRDSRISEYSLAMLAEIDQAIEGKIHAS